MKKICALLIVLVLMMSVVAIPAVAEYERLNIAINGETVYIPYEYGAVIIVDNRTMVPVRFVSEFLNFTVYWLESEQMVMFADATHVAIVFQIGGSTLFIDGRSVVMDVPAMLHDNRSYIPLRFFAEAIGFEVDWNEYTRTVSLDRN